MEKLRSTVVESADEAPTPEQLRARRKREGAFYTPSFVTRDIVSEALGAVLRERLEDLRARHAAEASGTARQALADPAVYDLDALKKP